MKTLTKQSRHDIEKRCKQKIIADKKFYCIEHNYAFNCITSLRKHLAGKKHNPELYIRYHCELCNYHTKIKYNFAKHSISKKHQQKIAKFQVKEELPIVYTNTNTNKIDKLN